MDHCCWTKLNKDEISKDTAPLWVNQVCSEICKDSLDPASHTSHAVCKKNVITVHTIRL